MSVSRVQIGRLIGVGQFDCIVVDYLHTRKFPSFTPYMRADAFAGLTEIIAKAWTA